MRILALDTTSVPGSAALLQPDADPLVSAPDDPRPFGARLPGWLLDLLARARLAVSDVDLFVVGAGPGSLTGLRVGIATMQGLAMASGRPLVAVSALEAIAHEARQRARAPDRAHVAALTNARRGEVFAQVFRAIGDGGLEAVREPDVATAADVAARWRAELAGAVLVIGGDAAAGSEPLWRACGVAEVVAVGVAPLAPVMAGLGARVAADGRPHRPHAVHPLYVRRPDAEVARERAAAAQAGHGRG